MTALTAVRPGWSRGWLACVWLASLLYIWPFVDRGWIPHDEGTLGQSAERILAGELPHRDFEEVYTGGLGYLHALAFRVLGVRLFSLRLTLFVAFVAWVPAVFWIASRFGSPPIAALVTATAIAWSLPNYYVALASWYMLFLTTIGVACLLTRDAHPTPRAVFAAGLCGGLSLVLKSTAVYYVAAAVLFLLALEALQSCDDGRPGEKSGAVLIAKAALVVGGLAAVVWLLGASLGFMPLVHFVLPIAIVGALWLRIEAVYGRGPAWTRARRAAARLTPFIIGVLLPVVLLLVPFVRGHALDALARGLFITPMRRLHVAVMPLPTWWTLLPSVPYAALLLAPTSAVARIRSWPAVCTVVAGVAGALLATAWLMPAYAVLWSFGRDLAVVAVAAGGVTLLRQTRADDRVPSATGPLLLLVTVTAFAGLVQFPYASPIYFCYVAPLVVLTLASLMPQLPAAHRGVHLIVALTLLLFAGIYMNGSQPGTLGVRYAPYRAVPLELARAGLRASAQERDEYGALVALVHRHRRGRAIYAAPDCPEVYFLTGSRNPTRSFYEIFDAAPIDPVGVEHLLAADGINLAVVCRTPPFSAPLSAPVQATLARALPQSVQLDHFQVRWAE
jgi:hypothetical protein